MSIPSNDSSPLAELEKQLSGNPEFVAEGLALEVAEQAVRIMHIQGISRAALADRMGVSRSLVSRTLNAPTNLTLRSLAQLALGLGTKAVVGLEAGYAISSHAVWPHTTRWSHSADGRPQIVLTIESGGPTESAVAWTSKIVESTVPISSTRTTPPPRGNPSSPDNQLALASALITGKEPYALAG